MKRVKVDFSTTVEGGLIRASQARVTGEALEVGDKVEASDPAEDLEFVGVVDHLSEDGRFAFLRMMWEDASPVACNVRGLNLSVTSSSAAGITVRWATEETSSEEGVPHVSPPQVGRPAVATAGHSVPA